MSDANETTLVLELAFDDKARFGRFVRAISGDPKLRRSILRARVTADGAAIGVKLSGPADRVDSITQAWGEHIARITKPSRIPA